MSQAPQNRYDQKYCALLVQHMSEGLSYRSFAGVVGCCFKTLYNWEKQFPEFKEAKDHGVALSLLWWERQGKEGLWDVTEYEEGKIVFKRSLNSTVWIFNMKNRFNWKDKPDEKPQDPSAQASKPLSKEEQIERSLRIREHLKGKK